MMNVNVNADLLTLTGLDDDALGTVLSLCDLPTIASAASTCRRVADLLRNPNLIVWHSHLRRVLSLTVVTIDHVELAVDAKTLLRGALRYPPPVNVHSAIPILLEARRGELGQIRATLLPENDEDVADWIAGDDCCVRAGTSFPTVPSPCTIVHRRLDADGRRVHKIALSTVSYFEVEFSDRRTVTEPGQLPGQNHPTPCVAIGLCRNDFQLYYYQPGWTENSIGYHSDDGTLYHGNGTSGTEFGPAFALGDVVGCGVHRPTGSVFFTLNGALIGTAFILRELDVPLYPIVGLDSPTTVTINFGAGSPFKFDPERAAQLYEASPPVERRSPRLRAASQLPNDFVCTYPVAASRHPWNPTATTLLIEMADSGIDD